MQTRFSDEYSVCPSVKRVDCDKTEETSVQSFIPYERSISLDRFLRGEWLVESDTFYLKFWVNRPPLEQIADFEPIFAHSASAVTPRPSEKNFN